MLRAFLGLVPFILAALWEAHVLPFLPFWADIHPLWPLVVVGLCLETDRLRLVSFLLLACVWEEIARPSGTPPLPWLLLPLLAAAAWLLRIWLSHRSAWSAILLVVFGRLLLVAVQAADLARSTPEGSVWGPALTGWAATLAWDVALTAFALQASIALVRRLAPYLPRTLRESSV